MLKRFCAFLLVTVMLAGCTPKAQVENSSIVTSSATERLDLKQDILNNLSETDSDSRDLLTKSFVDWLGEEFGNSVLEKVSKAVQKGKISNEKWHDITGNTATVLKDMYSGALDPNSSNYRPDIRVIKTGSDDTFIRIVGDVSFADNWKIAPKLDERGKGIYGVLSKPTVDLLKKADIFLLNNEFCYSDRGKPLAKKLFTFRAAPKRVEHLKEIGADIVSLANNHAYDFGKEAFADTLKTLKNADIPYIGGGKNEKEASKSYYFIVNGRKYAFSAATKAEKFILTPEAKENSSGVMRTYDPEKFLKVIKKAEEQCDYNIVYVHWGKEGSQTIESGLYDMGKRFINAGADIVVGAHAHMLQGIQFYKKVPIVYNLGNFIFNAKTLDSAILEIKISKSGKADYKFIPAIQKNCYTDLAKGKEKERILKMMKKLSIGVSFDESGNFTPTKN